MLQRWAKHGRWLGGGLVAALLAWVASVLPLGFMAILLIGAVLVVRRSWRVLLVFVLLTPPSLNFWMGVGRHACGRGFLMYEGLPGTECFNLDPQLRCPRYTSGCIVFGDEWMTHGANNAAMWLMSGVFGPQPGAYRGPYPTEDDAKAALANAQVVPPRDLLDDCVELNGNLFRLDVGVGKELVERSFGWVMKQAQNTPPEDDTQQLELTAVLWRGSCLILRVPKQTYGETDRSGAMIAVFDTKTGRPFAYYAEGAHSHHFPPVMWKK
jgi:hypothetical protein